MYLLAATDPVASPYYWLGYALAFAALWLLWKLYQQWRDEQRGDD